MTALTPIRAGLTPRQRAAYRFIRARLEADRSPSMREIANHLATHPGRAHALVTALVARGWILHRPNRARALALAPDAADDLSRPHAGTAPYRVDLPPALAREVADFADARRAGGGCRDRRARRACARHSPARKRGMTSATEAGRARKAGSHD